MEPRKQQTITGIGNAIVDISAYVEDEMLNTLELVKGSMQLCSKEFHKKILDEITEYEISPGGSAANSIATLSCLNIYSSFFGAIGDDNWGESFKTSLVERGVNTNLVIDKNQPTGKSVILITPDSERTMNTCLGASQDNIENFFESDTQNCVDYLVIEGYLLTSDVAWDHIKKSLPYFKENDTKIILTLSDCSCVEGYLSRFQYLVEQSWLVFANANELQTLYPKENNIDYDKAFPQPLPCDLVVTRSELGATIFSASRTVTCGTSKVTDIVDLTGAGDQFCAGYLYGVLQGWNIEYCAKFGNELAKAIISQTGPRFSIEKPEIILSEFLANNELPVNIANLR